jgi:hypothetical protein
MTSASTARHCSEQAALWSVPTSAHLRSRASNVGDRIEDWSPMSHAAMPVMPPRWPRAPSVAPEESVSVTLPTGVETQVTGRTGGR